jgi:hypothetical protein
VPDDSYTALDVGGEALDATVGTFGVAGVATVGVVAAGGAAAFAGGYWIGEKLMELFSNEKIEKAPENTFSTGDAIGTLRWVHAETHCKHCEDLGEVRHWYETIEGKSVDSGPSYGCTSCSLFWKPEIPSWYILTAEAPEYGSNLYDYAMAFVPLVDERYKWPYGNPQIEESKEEHCEYGFDPYGRWADWPLHLRHVDALTNGNEDVPCKGYIEYVCGEHQCRKETHLHETKNTEYAIIRTPAQMPANFPKTGRACSKGFECVHTSVPSLSGTSTELVKRLHESLNGGEEHHSLEKYIDALTEGHGGHELVPGTVEELAEALQVNNPKTELAPETAEAVAETCLEDKEDAGDDGLSECESLPIFASGSDVPSATEHDLKALSAQPQWVKLNYESSAAKEERGEKRGWYEGLGGCAGTRPESNSCDEYPFFATQQGGEAATPTPSLEYISSTDNSYQGSLYGGFVSSCKMPERIATDYALLAIPLAPSLHIPTVSLCN